MARRCARFWLSSATALTLFACSSATGVEGRLDRIAGSWEGVVAGQTLRLDVSSPLDFCGGCSAATMTVGQLSWDGICQEFRGAELLECRGPASARYCNTARLVIPFDATGDDRMTADLEGAVWDSDGSCEVPTDPVVDWSSRPEVELMRR